MSKKNLKNKKQKNVRSTRDRYVKPQRPIYLQPPTYRMQQTLSWRVRYQCTAVAIANTIQCNQLAAALCLIATSATATSFLCDQFKLKRVCVWGPVTTAGTPVSCMLKYVDDPASNTQSGPPLTQSDSSISFDRPAYVCLEPPKNNSSIFSQWSDSSLTTAWIVITCPVGAIVDFFFDYIIDDIGATQAGPTVAGATAGQLYHKTITAGAAVFGCVLPLNGIL